MEPNITMTVRNDGHVKGTANGFDFTALVFAEPSEFGINQGRVSKLFLHRDNVPAVVYDRKWEKEAETNQTFGTYLKVLSALEALPV